MALTSGGVAPQLPLDALQQITNALYALVKVSTPAAGIYVQKAGDTMSGNLSGTNATFSGTVTAATALAFNSAGRSFQFNGDGGGNFNMYDNTASAQRLFISTTGSCSASSAWGVISDASLKTNIEDHPYGLPEILKLQPHRFRMVTDDRVATGLIAQELEAVMPELVGEMATSEGTTVKTVTETGVIWPLVQAVKELTARIEALEQRLASQEGKT